MNLNVIGLILDIIGVILLWKFGLPENIDRSGTIVLAAEGCDESEKKKASMYDRISQFALLLLIVGFALQIVGNFQTQYASKPNLETSQEQNQEKNLDKEQPEPIPK